MRPLPVVFVWTFYLCTLVLAAVARRAVVETLYNRVYHSIIMHTLHVYVRRDWTLLVLISFLLFFGPVGRCCTFSCARYFLLHRCMMSRVRVSCWGLLGSARTAAAEPARVRAHEELHPSRREAG